MKSYLLTFFTSGLPFVELRGGFPLGIYYGLPLWHAFFVSLLGNIAAVILFRLLLPYLERFAMAHSPWINKKITHLYEKTHADHSHKVEAFGSLFLILFVAVPIPGSGGLTAMLIAYVFDLPYWLSLVVISLGLALSAFVIMGFVSGVSFLWLG